MNRVDGVPFDDSTSTDGVDPPPLPQLPLRRDQPLARTPNFFGGRRLGCSRVLREPKDWVYLARKTREVPLEQSSWSKRPRTSVKEFRSVRETAQQLVLRPSGNPQSLW